MKVLIFSIIILFQINPLKGQSIIHYTVDNGLPSSHVYSTFQDSKGLLWVCTDNGLARFDGYNFEVFTTKDGLPYNDIWGIQEDSKGRLWILSYASNFTYYSYIDSKFHVLETDNISENSKPIVSYIESYDNKIYAVTNEHNYFEIENKNAKIKKIIDKSFPKNDFFLLPNLQKLQKMNLTYLTNSLNFIPNVGVTIKQLKNNIIKIKKLKISDESAYFKQFVWKNFVVILTKTNLYFYNFETNETSSYLLENYNIKYNTIKNFNDINDNLFIIFDNRTLSIDSNLTSIKDVTTINIPGQNGISNDNENNIWISTNNGLFFIYKNKNFFVNINGISVMEVCKLDKNEIFVREINGKIYNLKSNTVFENFNENIISDHLTSDSKKTLFVSTLDGTYVIKNKLIIDFIKGQQKNIYSYGKYLYSIKWLQIVKHYKNKYILTIKLRVKIGALDHDNKNLLWIGSSKGLLTYSDIGSFNYLSKNKLLYPILNKNIIDLKVDAKNNVWCGTDGSGIYILINNVPFEIKELENYSVRSIFIDKIGAGWISTNKGAFRITINDYINFNYSIQKYSQAQGLPSNEINCIFTNDSFAYFGTSKGLGIININYKEIFNIKPVLYIKHVIISGDSTFRKNINLPYNKNQIEIEYTCLSYKSNKNILYKYKLDGIDNDWRQTINLKILYRVLNPGKYLLHLKAIDINGVSSAEKIITLYIHKAYWQTIWFKLLSILIGVGIIFYAIRMRTERIKNLEIQKIANNKKFADLELQALQAQMNPHFVFNSLNAIQSYILSKDPVSANEYLNKFSKLMRLVLESSREKFIILKQEIELINLYMELEKIRYKNLFEINFTLDSNINLNKEFPTMILQPFIENSINHGLANKKNGVLTVEFSLKEKKLQIIIDDNGIGRAEASRLKSNSNKTHKSRAMEITNERIKTLDYSENTNINIRIFDKFEDSKSLGTKVIITLNYLD